MSIPQDVFGELSRDARREHPVREQGLHISPYVPEVVGNRRLESVSQNANPSPGLAFSVAPNVHNVYLIKIT